jgi:endogenous inhibitor of DNA gyrase (YacG/DUF329 family)
MPKKANGLVRCIVCKSSIDDRTKHVRKRKFCSNHCRTIKHREDCRSYYHKVKTKLSKYCKTCHILLIPSKHFRKSAFCSKKCSEKYFNLTKNNKYKIRVSIPKRMEELTRMISKTEKKLYNYIEEKVRLNIERERSLSCL